MAFPVVGKQNAPQVWVPGELNAEQVEDFALEPIRAEPDGDQRIHDSIVAGQADADTDFLAERDGDQVVVQFVARFHRETVNARGIAEQIELQAVLVATAFGNASKEFAWDHDGGLTAEFNYFLDRVGAPCAQASDYNISGLTTALRHRFRNPALRRLGMPVERAFFPQIDVSDQEDGDVNEHLHEAVDSKTV